MAILEHLDQVALTILSSLAIWIAQDDRQHVRRWGSLFGLISQPFWFYTAYQSQAWGIFFMTLIYTLSWGRGVWRGWVRKPGPDHIRA